MEKDLIAYLSQFVTQERLNLFYGILSQRTNYITVVLEDIFHSHNASAVLRSCDCFGIQDVHVIENRHEYEVNPDIALGASKWLTVHKYKKRNGNNTILAISSLKKKNYRILATIPDKNAVSFQNIDVTTGPFALVFGGEKTGISGHIKEVADELITIPMMGFTESLNISVAVAILLQHFAFKVRNRKIEWKLNNKYQDEILLNWIRKSIRKVEIIEKDFFKNRMKSK